MSSASPIAGGKITSYTGMMAHPFKLNPNKLQQRLNPGQYIAPPAGATVVPHSPYIKSEWDDAADKLNRIQSNNYTEQDFAGAENNNNSSSAATDLHRRVVPPFVAGDGDRSLVHRRNFAATKLPVKPLQRKLLPYKVRRTAVMSMMHGGVRTTGLNMPYPDLAVTYSEQLALPTLQEERRDLNWDAADFALNFMPVNMGPEFRNIAWLNRCVDIYRRTQKEMKNCERKVYSTVAAAASSNGGSDNNNNNNNDSIGKKVVGMIFKSKNIRYAQPHSSQLRVEPYSGDEWQQLRADSAEARAAAGGRNVVVFDNEAGQEREVWIENQPAAYTQKDAYLPFQSLKPHNYGPWSYTVRHGALITANMDLKQERLNRKGFGWKSIQNKLWQQDMDTHRHSPDRGYLKHKQ